MRPGGAALMLVRKAARRSDLHRPFFVFPCGWPGAGLLLLRATVGLTAVLQGGCLLAGRANSAPGPLAFGLAATAGGAALMAGFLTPAAGALVGLAAIGELLSGSPVSVARLIDSRLEVVFLVIMTAAVLLLGPGAYSLDARLFGRREIVIPRADRAPKF